MKSTIKKKVVKNFLKSHTLEKHEVIVYAASKRQYSDELFGEETITRVITMHSKNGTVKKYLKYGSNISGDWMPWILTI